MRFVRRTTVNPRDPRDYRLYVAQTSDIIMGGRASLQLPKGATGDRSALVSDGLIRFNTTNNNVEVYQGSTWRSLRYAESTKISKQTFSGDGASTFYGLLSPAPAAGVSSTTWNLTQFALQYIILIDNVVQIAGTNYYISENPVLDDSDVTVPALTTTGTNIVGSTTITVQPTNNASTNFTDVIPNIKTGCVVTATVLGNPVFTTNTTVQTIGTTSFTINNPTLVEMPAGTKITLTFAAGYYIRLDSASVLNKSITVLHGFDK